MTASEASLLPFLAGEAHFTIPVYQRTYTWTRAQCAQLWKDITEAPNRGGEYRHFLGAVVYIEQKDTVHGAIPSYLVIDGQQRLTTVSLLLAALCERLPPEQAKATRNRYLVNGHAVDAGGRRKLLLTQRDRETLLRIAVDGSVPDSPAPSLVDNLAFFREKLMEPGTDPAVVLNALQALQFVNVKLKAGEDDPQRIFESLNATGVKLSQSDLVRNTLLMSLPLDEQQRVYDVHWHPLERLMIAEEEPERFDRMLRDYLGGERGALVNQRALHDEVRAILAGGTSRADLARDLAEYGRAWYEVAVRACKLNGETADALHAVRQANAGVAFPFLARLLFRLQREGGQESDLTQLCFAARWSESYAMRRLIVQIATNTMNRTFIVMARDCPTKGVETWLAARTARLGLTQRFPTDEETLEAVKTRDVYSMRGVRDLLARLENHDRKELVAASNYTVEHVLPQNDELRQEWRMMLGPDWQEIQTRRVHTLGNLTLTGYNSELSDRSFVEKKAMPGGFDESPVRLSEDLRRAEIWDEAAIVDRGQRLGDTLLKIWPRPYVLANYEGITEDPKQERNREFWAELLPEAARLTPRWLGRTPAYGAWMSTSTGLPGLKYVFWIAENVCRAELRMELSKAEDNKRVFAWFYARRIAFEEAVGWPLNWREMPDRWASSMETRLEIGSESDPDLIAEAIPELARRMAGLERACAPLIPSLEAFLRSEDSLASHPQ